MNNGINRVTSQGSYDVKPKQSKAKKETSALHEDKFCKSKNSEFKAEQDKLDALKVRIKREKLEAKLEKEREAELQEISDQSCKDAATVALVGTGLSVALGVGLGLIAGGPVGIPLGLVFGVLGTVASIGFAAEF